MCSTKKQLTGLLLPLMLVVWLVLPSHTRADKEQPCEGPFNGRKPTAEELKTVLERHKEWHTVYETWNAISATDKMTALRIKLAVLREV